MAKRKLNFAKIRKHYKLNNIKLCFGLQCTSVAGGWLWTGDCDVVSLAASELLAKIVTGKYIFTRIHLFSVGKVII